MERARRRVDGLGAQARQDRGVQPAAARRHRHELRGAGRRPGRPAAACATASRSTPTRGCRATPPRKLHRHHRPPAQPAALRRRVADASPRATASCSRGSASRWPAPRARCSRASTPATPASIPYTTAVSDIYQDLFGEGIFTGKGLYDVDAFTAALDGRVPENALLSHDLFEGLLRARRARHRRRGRRRLSLERAGARAAAAPLGARRLADPALAASRACRRARAASATACRSSRAGRSSTTCGAAWSPPATAGAPARGLDGAARQPARLDGGRARRRCAFPVCPLLLALLAGPRPHAAAGGVPARRSARTLRTALAQRRRCSSRSSPTRPGRCCTRSSLTLVRLVVTQRRLLEWETAAAARAPPVSRRSGARAVPRRDGGEPAHRRCSACAARRRCCGPRRCPRRCPSSLLWVAAPLLAYGLSRPVAARALELGDEDRAFLRRVARQTWRYFDTFAGARGPLPAARQLPGGPEPRVAHRTSPTNIGMGLLATLAAHDLGFIDTHGAGRAPRAHARRRSRPGALRGPPAQLVRHADPGAAAARATSRPSTAATWPAR